MHSLYGQKYWHPFFRREKALPNCDNKDGNIIHVLKNCISASVEFSKAFWSVLGEDLLEVLNDSFVKGFLPLSKPLS